MVESLGKRPKPPIKCLGYKGEYLFRDFLEEGNKMDIIHNIQDATIVEGVARSAPSICASLDNRQVDQQSTMIEVEAIIVEVPILISIDYGGNNCYINCNMIERFHLVRRKHFLGKNGTFSYKYKKDFND